MNRNVRERVMLLFGGTFPKSIEKKNTNYEIMLKEYFCVYYYKAHKQTGNYLNVFSKLYRLLKLLV